MKKFVLLVLALIITACGTNMPKPSVSEHVITDGGGFLMEKSEGVKYAMNYTLTKPALAATTYMVTFESTIPDGERVSTSGSIKQGATELLVRSPVIAGVKNNKTYLVVLKIFSDGELVVEHLDQVRFSVPSNILSQFGIKEY